jgi:hypothetical protein
MCHLLQHSNAWILLTECIYVISCKTMNRCFFHWKHLCPCEMGEYQVRVISLPKLSRPVHLGVGPPSWTHDQIFLLLSDICGVHVVGRPPWGEDWYVVFFVQFAITLGSTAELMTTPYSLILVSPRLYLFPQGTGLPSYTPGHWVPFCRLLLLTGL